MDMKQPLEKLVVLYGATVLRVCRAVVGLEDAEDVWQETFIAALRAYPELPPDANVEAWLVTIAHRKSLDAVKAVRRRAVPVPEVPESPSTHGIPDDERTADGIWRTVANLPDKQRQVIAYRYLADLPFNDIAAIVGGSPAAARRAASDGIKSLRAAAAAGSEGESA
jgi:RNA polymerase sigma factor (sigma-70 family)